MSFGSICGPRLLAMLVLGISTPSMVQAVWWPPRTCNWACMTYAPGTKSVIMARLLLRSAPGVSAMSSRLTRVTGVAEVAMAVGASVTMVTVATVDRAGRSLMRASGGGPEEETVMDCDTVANPLWVTVRA